MSELFALIFSGLLTGAVYGLVGLGKVIVFKTTATVNFAIADIATLAAFCAMVALHMGVPVLGCLALAMLISGLVGVGVDRLLLTRLKPSRDRIFIALVLMIGLGFVIRATIGAVWGHSAQLVPPLVDGTVTVGPLVVTWNRILAAALALLAMGFVAWFFTVTSFGVAMRASAEDPFAAKLIGINSKLVAVISWFIGGALAALAIFFLGAEAQLTPTFALIPLFRALAGVFLGGFTSMPGAVAGGFAIGVLDNLAGRYVSASFRDTMVFGIIVAVLFIRPAGLFGKVRAERV